MALVACTSDPTAPPASDAGSGLDARASNDGGGSSGGGDAGSGGDAAFDTGVRPTGCVDFPQANCPASQPTKLECFDGATPPAQADGGAPTCSPPTTITDGVDVYCCDAE